MYCYSHEQMQDTRGAVAFEGTALWLVAGQEMLLTVTCHSLMTIKKRNEGICNRNDLRGEQTK